MSVWSRTTLGWALAAIFAIASFFALDLANLIAWLSPAAILLAAGLLGVALLGRTRKAKTPLGA